MYSPVWFDCRTKGRIQWYDWSDRLSIKLPAKGQLPFIYYFLMNIYFLFSGGKGLPYYSVTWSYRNHFNLLICCLSTFLLIIIIIIIIINVKKVVLLNYICENRDTFFFFFTLFFQKLSLFSWKSLYLTRQKQKRVTRIKRLLHIKLHMLNYLQYVL